MASQEYVKLAQSLPPRLLRFFARYPPAAFTNSAPASSISTSLNTSPADPNASAEETTVADSPPSLPYRNPFQSQKHPATGKWHDPVFSLRRQADLVKMARTNGVEDLLPYTVKGTEERLIRRQEQGLRVKGTGVGQKVKGKLWERTQKGRLEKRRQAMLGMPKLVQTWKQVCLLLRFVVCRDERGLTV
jgi:large subunit ribosomal protein L25